MPMADIVYATRLALHRSADARLSLPFDYRSRSRLRAELPNGEAIGVLLERGESLRDGDQLLTDDGRVIEIVAAAETVSTVHCADRQQLARAAYHLGNRHVSLQVGEGWLRYRHDHVLDDMLRGHGLRVVVEEAPFEPEPGAYSHDQGAAPAHDTTGDIGHHHGDHHHHHR
jgi:urease accessory protein